MTRKSPFGKLPANNLKLLKLKLFFFFPIKVGYIHKKKLTTTINFAVPNLVFELKN